jgi:hypothetical protein
MTDIRQSLFDQSPVPISDRVAHMRALHPPGSTGHVILARTGRRHDGEWGWLETCVRVEDLETSPALMQAQYGGMQRYGIPSRSARRAMGRFHRRDTAHVTELGSAYLDLDYYRSKRLRRLPPEEVAQMVLWRLREANLPDPSYILFTGRGLCVVWLFDPVPAEALPRWRALMQYLTGRAGPRRRGRPKVAAVWRGLGLDAACKDPTRVFRICGTVNSKRGTKVRLLWPSSWDVVRRHDFDQLANSILPYTRAEIAQMRVEAALARAERDEQVARRAPNVRLTASTYWSTVGSDIVKLVRGRHGHWGEVHGPRSSSASPAAENEPREGGGLHTRAASACVLVRRRARRLGDWDGRAMGVGSAERPAAGVHRGA